MVKTFRDLNRLSRCLEKMFNQYKKIIFTPSFI
jgi:hypothetical protein